MDGAECNIEVGGEEIEDALEYRQGIPYIRYETVRLWIEGNVSEEDARDAWASVERTWLWQVGQALGDGYQVFQSGQVLVLGRMKRQVGAYVTERVERALTLVDQLLPGVSERAVPGKHMVLCLPDDHAAERYAAGIGCGTRWEGIFIHDEPVHVALRAADGVPELTLAHEMTHECLHHLRPPRWLNEAIAQRMEHILGRYAYDEPSQQQLEIWRKLNLTGFWSGEAFDSDPETVKAVYRLADHVLHQICRSRPAQLAQFILNARKDDAGRASALEYLGCELEVFVEEVLFPPPPEPSPAARFFRKLFKR